ncbi:DEAD/DEAH box helicase [Clostridium sp. SHJSY1]|uniref:DEAD/DEAH box helicase n=1 Tax=Clostridium sp. SHJSY1 TaxID=2942483 RepID=UPI002875C156|nr:DEAD/DEAH box helicase [Clostridium sp. SHJSY1]MDS0526379.1 DEAD/DEAH box helicase [Clostridium sp. SHJSY1]
MESFNELNLNKKLIVGLEKQGITVPTGIQASVIPEAIKNKDIIGEAHTGSGKTLAFILPLFEKINTEKREMQALILAPTHELVMQIDSQIKLLAKNSEIPVTSLSIIGDVNIDKQIKKLKDNKPHIIVGSTGRILDLIKKKKKITAHTIKTIVIDEADNLLDNTSSAMVKDVIKTTMKDRQLMVFSATINGNTLSTAKELMNEPIIFKNNEKVSLNPNIEHIYIEVDPREKFETLRKLIAATDPQKALVFVNKGYEINMIADKLNFHNKATFAIHKGVSKEQRQNALESFRNGKINILVSSDISARGLDIQGITHIINLDFPTNSNEYLHRAGRTARGANSGYTISLVTAKERAAVRIYEREFEIEIKKKKLSHGQLI